MSHRLIILFVFILFASKGMAQFRGFNLGLAPSTENPSLIVSPIDYSKIAFFANSLGQQVLSGQTNIDKIYSAVGGQVTRYPSSDYSVALRMATHSFLSSRNYHVGIGGEVEVFSAMSKDVAWNVGVHLMSNPAGKFMFGANYKNFEQVLKPFETQVVRQDAVFSFQMGYVLPISRKISLSQLLHVKSVLTPYDRMGVGQYGITLNSRRWSAGTGVRKIDETHYIPFVRMGLYRGKFMMGYMGNFDKSHMSFNKWTNEITIVYKL
jgi:hypothetical protein